MDFIQPWESGKPFLSCHIGPLLKVIYLLSKVPVRGTWVPHTCEDSTLRPVKSNYDADANVTVLVANCLTSATFGSDRWQILLTWFGHVGQGLWIWCLSSGREDWHPCSYSGFRNFWFWGLSILVARKESPITILSIFLLPLCKVFAWTMCSVIWATWICALRARNYQCNHDPTASASCGQHAYSAAWCL